MKSTKIITIGTKILITKTGNQEPSKNLFLPREGEYDIKLGDTIVNRTNGEQISDNVLARIWGPQNFCTGGTCKNQKTQAFKHITKLTGINDCLSDDFDANESVSNLEKMIYLSNHKFCRKTEKG